MTHLHTLGDEPARRCKGDRVQIAEKMLRAQRSEDGA
jgi:hypothetical protein